MRYETIAPAADELASTHDLVVAADGVNSATRKARPEVFGPDLDVRNCRYMWLATDKIFDAFTFIVAETEFGPIQVHAYPFSSERSTFIVEMNEKTWRNAGFDTFAAEELAVGQTDTKSVELCAGLLGEHLDGHQLLTNNSRWIQFSTVRNASWRDGNIVLLGDAAHTAHFSIGSGTKLAMEDSLALAARLTSDDRDVAQALLHYEQERRPVVESTQRAAQASWSGLSRSSTPSGRNHHSSASTFSLAAAASPTTTCATAIRNTSTRSTTGTTVRSRRTPPNSHPVRCSSPIGSRTHG